MSPRTTRESKINASRGGLVQFHADEQFLADLTELAQRYNLPVEGLVRLWVGDRLRAEMAEDLSAINKWLAERYQTIATQMQNQYEQGPTQIIHLIPFARPQEINPEDVRSHQKLIPPVELSDDFSGKINLHGFVTIKKFKTAEKPTGYVQVFRTGELESARILKHNDVDRVLFGDNIDADLIRSVASYCQALEAFRSALPVLLQIRFTGMKGYALRSRHFDGESPEIDVDTFNLPSIKVSDWKQVRETEHAADLLRRSLDTLWNAAGMSRSYNYSTSGAWLNPKDVQSEPRYGGKRMQNTRKNIVDLSGINPTSDRVDLLMRYAGRNFLLGKVRMPSSAPEQASEFACRVYQSDMDHRAKAMLQTASEKGDLIELALGNLRIRGHVYRIVEGYAGGAHDGTNIPSERNLMLSFHVEPA